MTPCWRYEWQFQARVDRELTLPLIINTKQLTRRQVTNHTPHLWPTIQLSRALLTPLNQIKFLNLSTLCEWVWFLGVWNPPPFDWTPPRCGKSHRQRLTVTPQFIAPSQMMRPAPFVVLLQWLSAALALTSPNRWWHSAGCLSTEASAIPSVQDYTATLPQREAKGKAGAKNSASRRLFVTKMGGGGDRWKGETGSVQADKTPPAIIATVAVNGANNSSGQTLQ